MDIPLVDTNIILRLLLNDNPEQSAAVRRYFDRLEQGKTKGHLSVPVIFEAVFILEKLYGFPRDIIADQILAVLSIPHLRLPGKWMFDDVFDTYVNDRLSFIDSYHFCLMGQLNTKTIVSYDRGFDRLAKWIRRVEPDQVED
jgi:predicted nucleic acid-binding protein